MQGEREIGSVGRSDGKRVVGLSGFNIERRFIIKMDTSDQRCG